METLQKSLEDKAMDAANRIFSTKYENVFTNLKSNISIPIGVGKHISITDNRGYIIGKLQESIVLALYESELKGMTKRLCEMIEIKE